MPSLMIRKYHMECFRLYLTLSYPGGENAPHVAVFLLYLLNSSFLGAEIFRLFLKFYGESFGIQFESVRFRSLL